MWPDPQLLASIAFNFGQQHGFVRRPSETPEAAARPPATKALCGNEWLISVCDKGAFR